jgi:hypothetical protein
MPQFHWLDSNVLMEAHRRYYSFDIAPGFWSALVTHTEADRLRSPLNVLKEIEESKDAPTKWAQGAGRKLFVQAKKDEQQAVGQISQYVLENYEHAQAQAFLAKADPWVVGHALVDKGIVVTQERKVSASSKRVKIPNVCEHFGIECFDTFALLKKLNVKLN